MQLPALSSLMFSTAILLASSASAEPLGPVAVAQLDAAIGSAISDKRIAGAAVIVAKDGEIVYRRADGLADVDANRPVVDDTIFRLTSLSKPIVTSAAVRLVEMGILDLDRPVTDWLPDFQPQFQGTTPVITLRQLLDHTSGIGYASDEGGEGPYTKAGVQDGGWGKGITLQENVERLASLELRFAPGTGWNYGLGIDVIGRVIERATDLPLEVAVKELVTDPLGMKDTTFHVPVWDQERLAANYRNGEDGPILIEGDEIVPLLSLAARFDPSRNTDADAWPSSGAGMSGTPEDMMRLLLALTDTEDGFLDGGSATTMMTAQTAAIPYVDLYMDIYAGVPQDGAGWAFGIGGAVLLDPEKARTPQSAGTFAWTGAYGNTWFIDPEKDIIVVSMTNTLWEGIYGQFAHDVRDAVYAGD